MRRAYINAEQSPDPSTQNGAVVVSRGGKVISNGYNAPADPFFSFGEYAQRPKKYFYFEHAERAAIFYAVVTGSLPHTVVCPWASCADCARAMVALGVERLVRHKEAMEHGESICTVNLAGQISVTAPEAWWRWRESIDAADEIMQAAGIEIIEWSGKVGVTILRDGKEWEA